MTYAAISDVLAKSGALAQCESVLAFPTLGSWSVALDEQCELELAYDDRLGLLHVSSDVAPCPDDAKSDLLRSLLEYNEHWLATGGVRFGLDGERGQLTLTASFATAGLEATDMAHRLLQMGQLLNDWRILLSDNPEQAELDGEPPADDVVLKA